MNSNRGIVNEDLAEILESGIDFTRFFGKTVLITGASGFLPAYLVETLLHLNDKTSEEKAGASVKVLALVRNLGRAEKRFQKYAGRSDLELIEQDVSQFVAPKVPVHFIIHAASQASPKYYGKDPVGTALPNTLGTLKLLEFARTQKLESFLFFSSGEVYGVLPPELIPTDEKTYGYVDPMEVRSCYGESKRMGENLCVSYAHQYQVPALVVRPFHTYGPGMLLDDGRVFSDFVANILDGKNIEMKSDGSAIRPYCYLVDAVRGFFTILLSGKTGEAYNVGNDQAELSVLELAELLVSLDPSKNLKVVRMPAPVGGEYLQSKISRNCPNIQKMKTLGWAPKYSPAVGFARTIQSFREVRI